MRKKTPRITIRALAFFFACLLSSVAFAQQPPQPCHITITSDFESQCLLPLDKDSVYNEEPQTIIACQENTVTYTATSNTGGIPVVSWSWSVAGASTWSDNGNGSITVTWGNGGTGQITVTITTANDYSCSMTQNVKLIEKPNILVKTAPAYIEDNNGDKIIYVCKGASVEFTDLSYTTNSDIVGYYWELENPTITSSAPNFRIEEVLDECKVTHRVYNNCGCYDEEVYAIKVLDGEILDLSCYGTVCHDATVTYTANAPGCDQYSWYVEGGTIIEGQDQQTVTVQWNHPQNGYGIIGLDGFLCHQNACPTMMSKKIPIIQDTLTITGQEVACVDEAVIYSVPLYGSTKYEWDVYPTTGADMHEVNGANQKSIVFTQPGIYYIKVSYECDFLECGPYTSKTLTVYVKPKLAIEGEERICISNNCELRTEPNVAALWKVVDLDYNTTIYTLQNDDTLSYHFPHAGKYRITAEHPDYCRPAVFVITVVAAPPAPTAADIDPDNPHVACPHSGILLNANPTNPDYTIVWKPTCSDATPQEVGGNSVTIIYGDTVCNINAFNYDRVLGCLSEEPYEHTVEEFQLASHNLDTSITVCPGEVLNFSVPYQSSVIYEWQLESSMQYCASVQGSTLSNSIELLINELSSYSKTFKLTLKREYCSDMVDYHTIKITIDNALSASSLTITAPSQVCQYSQVQLSGSGCNAPYEWKIENNYKIGETIDYTFNNPGNVTVTMKCNPYDRCSNSDYYVSTSAVVNVVAAPAVSGIGYNPNSTPPTVYVTPTSITPPNNDFVWGHTSTHSNSVPATPNPNGWDYTCTVIDNNSPNCSTTVRANVQPCQNILNVMQDISYDYCTRRVSFHVANPINNIIWSITGGEYSGTQTWGNHNEYISLRIDQAGYYTIEARVDGEPCYTGSYTFTVDFVPNFSIENGCGQIIIHNRSSYLGGNGIVRINRNGGVITFPVIENTITVPVPSGTYNLKLISFNGNTISQGCPLGSVTVANTANQPVTITLENDNPPLYQTCDNIAIQLTASIPAPHSIVKTVWSFGDNSSSSHSNPVYHTFKKNAPNYYTVTARITDENKCVSVGSVQVKSNANVLTPGAIVPDGDEVCDGDPRQIYYSPHPTGATYVWSPDINPPYSYLVTVFHTGDYHVDVENQYFCKAKKNKNIPFKNRPMAVIVTASSIYCEGETIKFYGSPEPDSTNYTFDWKITDDSTGNSVNYPYANISYTPSHAGNYTVTLTIIGNNGCMSSTTETITVNPTPKAPTIFFNGNECIHKGAVELSGTTPTTPSSIINWSNGYTGPNANYFTAGEARAWYYDINTGCKSKEAKIHIEPQPNFDALLTGCYEKCPMFFETNPRLPVWGLTSGREDINWKWYLNNNNIDNGIISYPNYYLSLPLYGYGDYNLNLDYHGGNCGPLESPTLTIKSKDYCDCKGFDVTYKYEWRIEECRLIYEVDVEVCNNSTNVACLSGLEYLFEEEMIHIMGYDFVQDTMIQPNDCYTFHMTIEVLQFVPSSSISFRIYDDCRRCTTDFSIDLMPEKFECEHEMNLDMFEVNQDFSSNVAAYFDFAFNVDPSQNVFYFWSEPPMVINYMYDGGAAVNGFGMIDIATLTQLLADDGRICFYAITCEDGILCKRKYCYHAEELYNYLSETGLMYFKSEKSEADKTNPAIDKDADPRLMPNPTNGEVNVIGTTDEVVEVVVLDMNGRQMATFSNTTNFNISNLSSGIYIVRVTTVHDNVNKVNYLKLVKK